MADALGSAPTRKKRSIFKRAAWQDAPKSDDDIFSHSKEFNDIVAEQARLQREDRRKEEEDRRRKHSEPHERKRRRTSDDAKPSSPPKSASGSDAWPARAGRTDSTARSRTSLSPLPSTFSPQPKSLAARDESLAKPASSSSSRSSRARKETVIVDLDDDEADGQQGGNPGDKSAPLTANIAVEPKRWKAECRHDTAVPPANAPVVIDDDDDDDDDDGDGDADPEIAAIKARARARVQAKMRAAAEARPDGDIVKAPIAQLFITPEMLDANPLMVRVRIDSTIEKPRKAWCERQGFSPQMTRNVFFTWKGTRLYDSTTIMRLGIKVDNNGNVSVDGDTNIYDDDNVPKIHVQAWTQELFKQRKEEEAAEAAAKKMAAGSSIPVEARASTPEPAPVASKLRVTLKARAKRDWTITVHPDTTFGKIASAYKTSLKIEMNQPLTLMFDGERLSPLDSVDSMDIEDEDSIEVLFK